MLTLDFPVHGVPASRDQLAFWAITVGANIAGKADYISDHLGIPNAHFGIMAKNLLLGGDTVGQEGLLRFYVLHVFVLPLILFLFIVFHFWRIRKDGGISSPKESEE